jgi:hypothetical protein
MIRNCAVCGAQLEPSTAEIHEFNCFKLHQREIDRAIDILVSLGRVERCVVNGEPGIRLVAAKPQKGPTT